MGVLILFAIAIPVFLDQRAKSLSDRTTVSIPASVAGFTLRTDALADRISAPLRNVDSPGEHLVGAYGGTTRPELVVMVTKFFMTETDQTGFFKGVSMGAVSSAAISFGPLKSVAPGPLGGRAECATGPQATMCAFADAGAYGFILTFGTLDQAIDLLPQVRSAVEHRS